jgi:NAD(P)-dependent dehydrogenase (short-subunit alcohol dehydrogenase family)
MSDAQKYTNKLRGARVLIVGGSAGIGYAVAEGCLEYGATVHIASSNKDRVAKAIDSLLASYPSAKGRLHGHTCDLSNAATLESNVAELFAAIGTLDHVISTAGDPFKRQVSPEGKTGIHAVTVESLIERAMVRTFAVQILAKHAIKYLEPSYRSSITLTTGSMSEKPLPGGGGGGGYALGLHMIAKGLALDLAPVRVNAVSPGGVETELLRSFGDDLVESFRKMTCTGRIAEPGEVAEAYLYLLKDTNCTGSVLRTDGGLLVR